MDKLNLNLIRTLVLVVDTGNLSEAARQKGCSRSYVSKEIAALEESVGASLLRRTTRTLELTDQGRAMYEHGVRMLEEMEAARSLIDSMRLEVQGQVRLSIPPGLGTFFLTQQLLGFQREHPKLALNLLLSNRVHDLVASQVDVAVQITTVPPLDVVAREIRPVHWGIYASHVLKDTLQALHRPEDLSAAPMLCMSYGQPSTVVRLSQADRHVDVQVRPRVQSESVVMLHRAMVAGLGLAVLPDYAVARELAAGEVLRALPAWTAEGNGRTLYIMSQSEKRLSYAAKSLIAFLRHCLMQVNFDAPAPRPACE